MKKKIKFKTTVTSMMRNGPVEGNGLRLEEHDGVISLEVCYSLDSTARGHISIPAHVQTLRSLAGSLNDIATTIEKAQEEPDEVVLNEYEPDEVVLPGVYNGSRQAPSQCTCHERDSSYRCEACHAEGYYGHCETPPDQEDDDGE